MWTVRELFESQLERVQQAELSAGRSRFLFRGQTDSGFGLTTTLERIGRKGERISDYYHTISVAKPQIETFTQKTWDLADWPEVDKLLKDYDMLSLHRFPDLGTYSYMVHLRHHGFPSPLLDWTRSPYIAAYFAFRSTNEPSTGKVSIYAFSEKVNFKISGSGSPLIRRVGPYVRTHKRHFLQQSDYTICILLDDSEGWRFAMHDDTFSLPESHQDFLWKFNIPWAERLKVLRILDGYNLNAFSLFDSEEALMETMALRTASILTDPAIALCHVGGRGISVEPDLRLIGQWPGSCPAGPGPEGTPQSVRRLPTCPTTNGSLHFPHCMENARRDQEFGDSTRHAGVRAPRLP
jgi:hypothetical protein